MPKLQPLEKKWQDREITIDLDTTRPPFVVKLRASCWGSVAVHQDHEDKLLWVVTAIAARVRLSKVKSQAAAFQIGEILQTLFGAELREPNPDKLRVYLEEHEPWVKPWLLKCRDAGRYVEPEM